MPVVVHLFLVFFELSLIDVDSADRINDFVNEFQNTHSREIMVILMFYNGTKSNVQSTTN